MDKSDNRRYIPLPRLWLCLAIMLLAAATTVQSQTQSSPQPAQPPAVAASVNEVDIVLPQLDAAVTQMFTGSSLKWLIDRELVRQEAARNDVSLTDEQLKEYMARSESQHTLQQQAGRLGLDANSYRSRMAFEALLEVLAEQFRQRLILMEARAYYEAHKSSFTSGPAVHVLELVTDDIRMAYLATERIKSGEQFITVAQELSMENQESGGDLGWMAPEDYHLTEQINSLEISEVSPPIAEGNRYYVLCVKDRVADKPLEFEDVREDLTGLIATMSRMDFSDDDYLELLARRADIRINRQPLQFLNDYYRELQIIHVIVDEQRVALTAPVVRLASGGLMVPLKPICQALHATVTWDEASQSLLAETRAGQVTVTAESASVEVGKTEPTAADMAEAAQLRDGVLYAPPRDILEPLGASVEWDAVRNRLVITSPRCPDETGDVTGLELEH
jgi:foldase protein PrsA